MENGPEGTPVLRQMARRNLGPRTLGRRADRRTRDGWPGRHGSGRPPEIGRPGHYGSGRPFEIGRPPIWDPAAGPPESHEHQRRGALLTEVFAHRGSAQLARENTVAAFRAAKALGADGIELDVHLSADGALVVHHDAELPGQGPIADLSSGELPDWLPSLTEALDASRPLQVNIEIKSEPGTWTQRDHLLASKVAELALSREEVDRFVVSSFSLAAVDAVHGRAPRIATALLIGPAESALEALATAHDRGHRGLHPFFPVVDETLVSAAKAVGIAIRPWTVDDPRLIAALARIGVDAVITNDVTAALGALGRSQPGGHGHVPHRLP